MEDDSATGFEPAGRDVDVALVDTCRVERRDLRWQPRERHLDVRVVRLVPAVRHRPEAGDVGLGPVGPRRVLGRSEELEAPAAVELEAFVMVDAVHGQSADPVTSGLVHGWVTSAI